MMRDCEYDNYQVPEYDPSIPPEERARLIRETREELDAIVEEVYKATH